MSEAQLKLLRYLATHLQANTTLPPVERTVTQLLAAVDAENAGGVAICKGARQEEEA